MKNHDLSEIEVSVIVPIYNGAKYISDCVESILTQEGSFTIELIIINDASTDNTLLLLNNLKRKFHFHLYNLESNKGQGYCRNLGIEKSTKPIIAFIDSDDIWESNKLSRQLKYHFSNSSNFTFTNYSFINSDGTIIKEKQSLTRSIVTYETLLCNNYIGTSTVIINRSVIGSNRFSDFRKKQDYLFWLDILNSTKIQAHFLNESLTRYRKHSDQITSNKISLIYLHFQILNKHQKLSFLKSIYYTISWGTLGLFKHYIYND